jgi:hypothetical protein
VAADTVNCSTTSACCSDTDAVPCTDARDNQEDLFDDLYDIVTELQFPELELHMTDVVVRTIDVVASSMPPTTTADAGLHVKNVNKVVPYGGKIAYSSTIPPHADMGRSSSEYFHLNSIFSK